MLTIIQIAKQKLLKDIEGRPYTSPNSITKLVREKLKKKSKIIDGKQRYELTEEDITKLQNLINKHKGIWNTPTTTKSNTSG